MCPYTSLLSMFGYIIIMVLSYESLEDCQSFGIKTDKHLSNFIELAIDFPIGNFGIIASESPLFQESVILARGAPPPNRLGRIKLMLYDKKYFDTNRKFGLNKP